MDPMLITTHYTLTPAEALRGSRTFKRLGYNLSLASGAVLLVAGLVSAGLAPGSRGLGVVMVLNGLLFLLLPEALLRLARSRRGSLAYVPMTLRLDDEGLTLSTETSEGSLPWAAFSKIQRRSGFWIFRISASQAVLLPERALEPADGPELEAFLAARKQGHH
jgi:hypothetical protein